MRWRWVLVGVVVVTVAWVARSDGDSRGAETVAGPPVLAARAEDAEHYLDVLRRPDAHLPSAVAEHEGRLAIYGSDLWELREDPVRFAGGGVMVSPDGSMVGIPAAPVVDLHESMLASWSQGLALLGTRCDSNEGERDTGAVCQPGTLSLQSYDPGRGIWVEVALPAPLVSGPDRWGAIWVHGHGEDLVLTANSPWGVGDPSTRVWTSAEVGRWVERPAVVTGASFCTTGTDLIAVDLLGNAAHDRWAADGKNGSPPSGAAVTARARVLDMRDPDATWEMHSASDPIPIAAGATDATTGCTDGFAYVTRDRLLEDSSDRTDVLALNSRQWVSHEWPIGHASLSYEAAFDRLISPRRFWTAADAHTEDDVGDDRLGDTIELLTGKVTPVEQPTSALVVPLGATRYLAVETATTDPIRIFDGG